MAARIISGFVGGLLDRAVLVGAVIGGGLLPGFIAQYRQRLGGRLDQALLDLAPWQKLADQFENGSLELLIHHHLNNADPQFRAEGAIIRSLVASVQQLQGAVHAMQGSLLSQAGYLLGHADPSLVRATYASWVPTFALSAEGLTFALLAGVGVWLLFKALALLIGGLLGRGPAVPHRPSAVRRSGRFSYRRRSPGQDNPG